jgi:lipoate-protein ligase A
MHQGQYKTPGGKLVAVDADIVDGRLRGVVLHGDFFLYPDEALEPLTASLEGVAVADDAATIAARVQAALPAGAELLGASPEGIAIAVRRLIEAAQEVLS